MADPHMGRAPLPAHARTDDDEWTLPVHAHAQAAARVGRWERSTSVHDGLEHAASVRTGTGRTPSSRCALTQSEADAAVRAEWDDADDLETSFNSYRPRLGTDAPKLGHTAAVFGAFASSDSARSSARTTPATSPATSPEQSPLECNATDALAARLPRMYATPIQMPRRRASKDRAPPSLPLFLNPQ